jgi:hypothetical protein
MQNIVLSSTLHDPQGRLLKDLPSAIKVILDHYDGWVVSYTPITNRRVKELLLHHRNIYTKPFHNKDLHAKEQIEYNHLRALEIAVDVAHERNIHHIQYTDADRVIMAANRFPESFDALFHLLKKYSRIYGLYINLRRTPDDFLTHHLPLVQTEKVFNELYTEVFGIPIDIGSTAHVMSLDVAEAVLKGSSRMEPVSFPHPKWLIIARLMDAQIYSVEISRLLTFESPEQYKEEIIKDLEERKIHIFTEKEIRVEIPAHKPSRQKEERLTLRNNSASSITRDELDDDYFLLQQAYESTIGRFANVSQREWRLRYHTQHQYLSVLLHWLTFFNLETGQERRFIHKITRSIETGKTQKEQILHLLRRKASEVEITIKEKLAESA